MSEEIKNDNDTPVNDDANQDEIETTSKQQNHVTASNTEQKEDIIEKISTNDKNEIEPSCSTSSNGENLVESSSTDNVMEKIEEKVLTTNMNNKSPTLSISEEDNTTVADTIQLKLSDQSDDIHSLLQNIVTKSNKEANLFLLNTVKR